MVRQMEAGIGGLVRRVNSLDLDSILERLAASKQQEEPEHHSGQHSPQSQLPFKAVFTNGGAFSDSYSVQNLFQDDRSCYCSTSRENVTVVGRFRGGRSCTVTGVTVRVPSTGFTSPLGQGIVFVSWEKPELEELAVFDGIRSLAECQEAVKVYNAKRNILGPEAVLFFDMHAQTITADLAVPRAVRYVVIKMLRPMHEEGTNIDVQYVGFTGWAGPHAIASASLM
jgi:hypothetical protein